MAMNGWVKVAGVWRQVRPPWVKVTAPATAAAIPIVGCDASATYFDETCDKAHDGDRGTYWWCSAGGADQWIWFDLGSSQPFTSISTAMLNNDRPQSMGIEGSDSSAGPWTIIRDGIAYSATAGDQVWDLGGTHTYRYVRLTGVFSEPSPPWGWQIAEVTVDYAPAVSEWREADRGFVKVAGAWRQWYTKSDPVTNTYWANKASQTYRGSGSPSGGSNRGVLSYWGDGWNSEQELSWIALNDPAGLQADLAVRPYIISGRLYHWVGHVYSGTQPVWWGWSDQNSEPGSWPGRIDGVSESDPAWGIPGSFPKPPSGAGAEHNFPIPRSVLDTLQTEIPAGRIQALTLTSETSTGNPQWGWSSGSSASTSNSGGSSGGIQDISNTTDPRSLRIELELDFAPPATVEGFI